MIILQQILVLLPSKSPEMTESLDGGLFVRDIVGLEGLGDNLSELVGEVFAEIHDEVNDLLVHVREI